MFRVLQSNAVHCTFEDLVPGYDSSPDMAYSDHLARWTQNVKAAAHELFVASDKLTSDQLAKTEGDVLHMLLAASLWNAAADWNTYMDTGKHPEGALVTPDAPASPDRKVAVVMLPRGYDATSLFTIAARSNIEAFNYALAQSGNMELRLSSPDIVCVRLPSPVPPGCLPFLSRLPNLRKAGRAQLEAAHTLLHGRIEGHEFLSAVAVKKSVRSDRLYQPLYEANVFKFLVREVLRGAALRFHVHVLDTEGAAVEAHYRSASLYSLLRGGHPELAVDRLITITTPRAVVEDVIGALPLFPL